MAGYIAPQEQFLLTLPVSGYTGRYLQQGCGGLCGLAILGSAGSGGAPSPRDSATAASAATCATVSAARGGQRRDGDGLRQPRAHRRRNRRGVGQGRPGAAGELRLRIRARPGPGGQGDNRRLLRQAAGVLLLQRLLRRRARGARRGAALPTRLQRHPGRRARQYRGPTARRRAGLAGRGQHRDRWPGDSHQREAPRPARRRHQGLRQRPGPDRGPEELRLQPGHDPVPGRSATTPPA